MSAAWAYVIVIGLTVFAVLAWPSIRRAIHNARILMGDEPMPPDTRSHVRHRPGAYDQDKEGT